MKWNTEKQQAVQSEWIYDEQRGNIFMQSLFDFIIRVSSQTNDEDKRPEEVFILPTMIQIFRECIS